MKRYDKLVRDKIPEICEANGTTPQTRLLKDDIEYLEALTAKLCEEVAEVRDNPSLEELADVLEIIQSIGKVLGISPERIEAARADKAERRGGFDQRIFLISTETK